MSAKIYHRRPISLAIAVLLGLYGAQASALSLGALTVQSALGEPLKAEVEILSITPEEAASIAVKVAPVEAFQAAGLQYNAVLSDLQASLQRRPDGSSYLRLTSEGAVNEPFIDMLLETKWNSGHIVRDYTMLFDPPALRNQLAGAQLPAVPTASVKPKPPATSSAPAKPSSLNAEAMAVPLAPSSATPGNVAQASKTEANPETLKVKAGSTAGKIARAHKSADVSLDQMLVALLQSNPNAFIRGNVNLIKAGAIITLPTQQQASSIDPKQAKTSIALQSRDFNAYRRKLASNVRATEDAKASRDSAGKVQVGVDDKKPSATNPDKLTLSQGSVQAKSDEQKLAEQRNTETTQARAAELDKNIKELNQLAQDSTAAASSAVPAASVAAATSLTVAASAAATEASAATSSAAPVVAPAETQASKPAAPKPAPLAVSPPPEPEPSFIDQLLGNPLLLGAGAAVIALLAAFGLYKRRQKKQDEQQFDELTSDSDMGFSDSSGGQHVNTEEHNMAESSSMIYPMSSQLEEAAAQSADPLDEADVCLNYGNDVQAEEILKEALQAEPQRLAIHQKLLDIYATRRDSAAFAATAAVVREITKGSGAQWRQVCSQGLAIDPNNKLYLPPEPVAAESTPVVAPTMAAPAPTVAPAPKEQPAAAPDVAKAPVSVAAAAEPVTTSQPAPSAAAAELHLPSSLDLNLDLDFSLKDSSSKSALAAVETVKSDFNEKLPSPITPTPAQEAAEKTDNPFDALDVPWTTTPVSSAEAATLASDTSTSNSAGSQALKATAPTELPFELALADEDQLPARSAHAIKAPLEFDLGSLSIDMGDDKPATPDQADDANGLGPLETKLALAEEFISIGDHDAARTLIEEVIAAGSGDLKTKAQSALAKL